MDNPNVALMDTAQKSPCPVCNGREFEWGRVGQQVYYVPGDNMWTIRGYQRIRARRCVQCNNLLTFVDPELTRKQRLMVLPIIIIAVALGLLGVLASILASAPHVVISR